MEHMAENQDPTKTPEYLTWMEDVSRQAQEIRKGKESMALVRDANYLQATEFWAWKQKIRKDLAAAGIKVAENFKIEQVNKKLAAVRGFPPLDYNPLDIGAVRAKKRPAGKNPRTGNNIEKPPKNQEASPKLKNPARREQRVVPVPVESPNPVHSKEHVQSPRNLQEVYSAAVKTKKTDNGYSLVDLSTVAIPSEWKVQRYYRNVSHTSDMRLFIEKLTGIITLLESSPHPGNHQRTIAAHKAKLLEIKKYY